jgi:hypothetical protein
MQPDKWHDFPNSWRIKIIYDLDVFSVFVQDDTARNNIWYLDHGGKKVRFDDFTPELLYDSVLEAKKAIYKFFDLDIPKDSPEAPPPIQPVHCVDCKTPGEKCPIRAIYIAIENMPRTIASDTILDAMPVTVTDMHDDGFYCAAGTKKKSLSPWQDMAAVADLRQKEGR